MNYDEFSNTRIAETIDDWVKGERNREIMKRRLIDGILYEKLAEEFDLSARHVKTIIYKNEKIIFKHLEGT